MKTGLFKVLFLFLSPIFVHAQKDRLENPTPKSCLFPSEYGNKTWKFLIGLDARRSFFKGAPVKINGIRIGTEYKGVHRFGLGTYGLDRHAVFKDVEVDQPGAIENARVVFNVNFISIFYERIFYKSKKWELAIPAEYSGGIINGYYEDTSSAFLPLVESPFSALSLGFQTKYYVFPWLAPRFSIGYRQSFNTAPEVTRAFNQPYYSFGLQILVVELYRSIFKREEE